MRQRSGRARRTSRAEAEISPAYEIPIGWSDLSEAERTALKRLNRGPYPGLDETVGLRLVDLGLAASRPGGIGISRIGREMVINMLLDSRQKEGD